MFPFPSIKIGDAIVSDNYVLQLPGSGTFLSTGKPKKFCILSIPIFEFNSGIAPLELVK